MKFVVRGLQPVLLTILLALSAPAQSSAGPVFPPFQQWKEAVLSGSGFLLKGLYSTNPPAEIKVGKTTGNADTDIAFWTGLKAQRMKVDVVQTESPQPGVQQVTFQAELRDSAGKTLYISAVQLWQKQSDQWRLVAGKRTGPARLQQPSSVSKKIYDPGANAHTEITEALALASKQHKRVLVVFGANWCYDCHVLDLAFHRPDVASVLSKNYEVIHIDVGEGDKNQDLMQQYDVPMKKGIPAIAVLDGKGTLLYSQKGGEFENARALSPEDVLAFLEKWKPAH